MSSYRHEHLVDHTTGVAVAEPSELGLDPEALEKLVSRARREVERGELPSCQVAVACHGHIVVDRTFGAPAETRYVTFSCTKALVAAAIWRLLDRRALRTDTRVADLIDGFGANGKESVTVEHLLTHTAGFPRAEMGLDDWSDAARRVARFGAWTTETEPGTCFEYHGTSASWVLAHLIEVAAGEDFRNFLRDEVLDPLGLAGLTLGVTAEHPGGADPAPLMSVGEPPDPERVGAIGLDIAAIGADQDGLLLQNDPALRRVGQPAGGAIGRAADLAIFYQALLSNDLGLWSPRTLHAGTGEIRCSLVDPMTGVPANRTLGLVVAGNDGRAMMRGFGHSASPKAFGHMGAGGQIAWGDPRGAISFAYLTNGLERDPERMGARGYALGTIAAALLAGTRERT